MRVLTVVGDIRALRKGEIPPSMQIAAYQQKQQIAQLEATKKLFADAAQTSTFLAPEKRQAYIDARAAEFDKVIGPGNGDAFKALAERQASFAAPVQDALKLPEVAARVGAGESLVDILKDPKIVEKLGRIGDQAQGAGIISKLSGAQEWLQKNKPALWAKLSKDGVQLSDFETVNDLLPSTLQLDARQMDSAKNNADILQGAGIEPPAETKLRHEKWIEQQAEIAAAGPKAFATARGTALGQAAAESVTGPKPATPEQTANIEKGITTEYTRNAASRQGTAFLTRKEAMNQLEQLARDPKGLTGVSAVAAVANFMRLESPSVNPTETNLDLVLRAANYGGIVGRTAQQIANHGEGIIPQGVVKEIRNQALPLFLSSAANQLDTEADYRSRLKDAGGKAEHLPDLLGHYRSAAEAYRTARPETTYTPPASAAPGGAPAAPSGGQGAQTAPTPVQRLADAPDGRERWAFSDGSVRIKPKPEGAP